MSMATFSPLNNDEILLCERLRSMKLSGMADAFATQLQDPNADLRPFMERFTEVVNQEWQNRYDKKFNRLITAAGSTTSSAGGLGKPLRGLL